MTARGRRVPLILLPLLVLGWACGGSDLALPPGPQTQLQVIAGDDQVGLPGQRLDDPLVVRLLDPDGVGIPNRTVVWVVNAGGGTVSPTTGMTDAEGFALAEWVLGASAGPNRVEAQVPGIGSVTFSAVSTDDGRPPGPSADASSLSASPSSIQAGSGSSTVTVTVRDENGDPISGATVTLEATGEGVTLTQPSAVTTEAGVATGTLASSSPGSKVVSAVVNGSVRLTETATVTVTEAPAEGLRMVIHEGDGQSAPTGSSVPTRPAVRVTTDGGDPVSGVQVTFRVTSGGGSVAGTVQTTDANGVARVGDWILGPAPGTNTLEASSDEVGGSPVTFTAEGTSTAGEVDRLVYLVQPPSSVERQERFRVEVALVDADGNVVPLDGIFIYLGLFREGSDRPTNDDLEGERFENTQDGVAVFEIAVSEDGRFSLRALTDDLPELGPHGPEPYLFSEVFEVD
jgi:hypothetical protein